MTEPTRETTARDHATRARIVANAAEAMFVQADDLADLLEANAAAITADANSRRLTWTPPVLEAPETITLSNTSRSRTLDRTKDYVVRLGDSGTIVGEVALYGGRRVILEPGVVDATGTRALYLQEQTEAMYVQGVHLAGPAREGINLNQRRGATVTLQDLLVDGVEGTQATNHADVIQTWAGPFRLQVDRLMAKSGYQGMFIHPFQFPQDGSPKVPVADVHLDLRNVLLDLSTGAYALYKIGAFGVHTQNVMVIRNPAKPWPDQVLMDTDVQGGQNKSGTTAGDVWEGVREVPAGTPSPLLGAPGVGYVNPGYVTA